MSLSNVYLDTFRGMSSADTQTRLVAKVARMYHEQGLRQGDIAERLHISQPRVSRLLKKAAESGIVRTTVVLPPGIFTDLEDALEKKYGLLQAVVVDVEGDENDMTAGLAAAAAEYLSATLIGSDTIGVSSWSASLLATVAALRPFKVPVADSIVQVVGGLGNPKVEILAAQLISHLARATGADAVFLPAPGVLGSSEARASLMNDSSVAQVMELWRRLTLVLVGIGAVEPSDLLRESGNVLADIETAQLESAGAVGDICLRFFDADGIPVSTDFNERVVGISREDLMNVPRRVGVAGGERKYRAIRGCILGSWVNVLITDTQTAKKLLEQS